MNLIGIDIGTTSISGLVFDTEAATVVRTRTIPNQRRIPSTSSYEYLQDADALVDDVRDLVQQLAAGINVDGLSVTGQMHGIVYVDENGMAVSPLYTWQDQRGNLQMETRTDAQVARTSEAVTYAQWLTEQGGYRLAAGYGIVTHFYLQQNAALPERAIKFCTIADYVGMRLVGRTKPVTDATNGASLGCFKLHEDTFDAQALHRCGIDTSWLPEVAAPDERLGLHGQIPVFNGIGDNQASFLGSVQRPDAALLVNIGTGAQIVLYDADADGSPMDDTAWETRPYMDGGFLHVGASLAGGQSYALLEQFFREVCMAFGGGSDDSLYEQMEALGARRLNDAEGQQLRVNPQFAGSRADPNVRGSITDISLTNFTPAALIEGFLRGMVRELASFLGHIPRHRRTAIQTVVGSGNAIRKNNVLQEILSAEFERPITIVNYDEEAALGAALHAAVCCGAYPDYHAAAAVIERISRT